MATARASISRGVLRFLPSSFLPNKYFFFFTSIRLISTTIPLPPTYSSVPLTQPTSLFNSSSNYLSPIYLKARLFSSESNTNSTKTFAFSDSEEEVEDDDDDKEAKKKKNSNQLDKLKLPPPYDPFNKKPIIEEPKDPKDLQEIFHKMRTEGLMNNAIKMFDALSKDGLTHEAMKLFSIIKDKGNMPDVVAHTAVIEAYANAGGHSKEALKVFLRMLSSGVKPNAYTYTVLIKGLSKDGKLKDVKKYVLEMMDKGIKPNAGTYTSVFEAFAREDKAEDGRELLEQMKAKGFVPDEKVVRDHLSQRGQVFRTVLSMLFNK
ncbi:Pentatricopeptide repeat-containing protein [Thalictrum thalictroides]|uniref:Pentatricopeptide repeat-containing protein n=1 Tax=Thalictrum thalictroides TaxID=46969 RepID=A0A7J6URF9_THATH|nr:Pentatricopeptide repeat-containing protein [Thalictrum thalictroides]